MAGVIYGLCALTAFLSAYLLLKAYHKSQYKLLLWGSLCFAGLTLANALLIFDKLIVPMEDLATWRYVVTIISMLVLLYGLIWNKE